MAEFFLELFSEEIPSELQKNLREKLLEDFQSFFLEKSIKSKKSFSLSTPNRLIIVFESLEKEIKIDSKEIRGPKIEAPQRYGQIWLPRGRVLAAPKNFPAALELVFQSFL